MSWIKCKCGNVLKDTADNISYKGRIISDKEYLDMLDLADTMIESTDPDREEAAMSFRMNIGNKNKYIWLKDIFQCPDCGRILLENNKGEFCSFIPEDNEEKRLLDYKGNGEIRFMKRRNL